MLCGHRLQLARCACSTLVLSVLALVASAARWLRRALPSPPSARAVRVLDAGALCAGASRFGGSVASACFAVAAFSSRGARARRWCSQSWRKSLRRLNGFGVLCRRRLQLARCACSALVLSVLAQAASVARWLRRALPSPPPARAVRVLGAGALCAGASRFGGSVASACFAVAAFSSRGARARRWCSLCWRKSLRWLGGFGVLCRRRLQLARCACSTLVLSVLA